MKHFVPGGNRVGSVQSTEIIENHAKTPRISPLGIKGRKHGEKIAFQPSAETNKKKQKKQKNNRPCRERQIQRSCEILNYFGFYRYIALRLGVG
ncbi:hypothetical protein L873DRAFT_951596 [Choiromyces venosus 120613-1]|uniref:Uncharacterized protein n=1 Tax=Choiromyces venosus 120613-1 TaxID=1336337 RepID=A0A3N4K7E7_9PEZI|nr:hypothetical protein L873DRAFT_951596 [Choiromyces venosus 120613-1]